MSRGCGRHTRAALHLLPSTCAEGSARRIRIGPRCRLSVGGACFIVAARYYCAGLVSTSVNDLSGAAAGACRTKLDFGADSREPSSGTFFEMITLAPRPTRGNFFARYRPREATAAPKYAILRDALIAAIEDGHWKSGDQLPNELELTAMTPYSLGTVQRAIQSLVAEGFVTRKQRSGSYVAPTHKRIGGPWLFRFIGDDGRAFLPMYTKVTGRRKVVERGPWFDWLARHPRKGTPAHRSGDPGRKRSGGIQPHVSGPRGLPVHRDRTRSILDGANIVHVIQEAYRLPVSKIAHMARAGALQEFACKALDLRRGTVGIIVEIAESAGGSRPVSYQQLFLPPTKVRIYISESSGDWHSGHGVDAPGADR